MRGRRRAAAFDSLSPISSALSSVLPYAGYPPRTAAMPWIAIALIAVVALLHLYFLVLEMFLWTKPLGMKVFRNTPEKAELTRVLAANQGLYNGFLVAGLVWGLVGARTDVATFFLGCVVVAGA